jgi:hypothetical protein
MRTTGRRGEEKRRQGEEIEIDESRENGEERGREKEREGWERWMDRYGGIQGLKRD